MIPELVATFDRTLTFMQELVADLSDEDMVLHPEGVPNHAAWTLGHIVHSCEAIPLFRLRLDTPLSHGSVTVESESVGPGKPAAPRAL